MSIASKGNSPEQAIVLRDWIRARKLRLQRACSVGPLRRHCYSGPGGLRVGVEQDVERPVRGPVTQSARSAILHPPGVTVRVHDSNADMRYLILAIRPAGTEGLGEEQLALVTRESMNGV